MKSSLNWVKKRQGTLINLTRLVCSKAGIKMVAVKSTALNAQEHSSLNPQSDKVDFAIRYEDRKLFKEYFSKFTGDEFLYEDPYSYPKASFCGARIFLRERGVVDNSYRKGTYPNKFVCINIHWIVPVNNKVYWDSYAEHKKLFRDRDKFQRGVHEMNSDNMNVVWAAITAPFRILSFGFRLFFDLLFSRVISNPKHNAYKYSRLLERMGKDADKYVLSGEPFIIYNKNYFDELERVNIDSHQYWLSLHNAEKMDEIYGVYDQHMAQASRYDYK